MKYDATNAQLGINITITVNDYNIDRVLLVYNATGGAINLAYLRNHLYNTTILGGGIGSFINNSNGGGNFTIVESNGSNSNVGPINLANNLRGTRSDVRLTAAPGYLYSFNISNSTWGRGASDGTTFNYVFVVYDLYNNSEIINSSNSAFTIGRDIDVPTASITAPTTTSIEVSNAIKYTCDCADSASGVSTCTTKLTKPSDGTVTKTGDNTEHTFTGTDTNEAGTYTVACTAVDNVGRTGDATSKTFSVSYAAGTSGTGGGGGSGGGGSAGSSASNPVVVQAGLTSELGTLSTSDTFATIPASGGLSFSVNNEAHTAKVLTVTSTSVTIEFASTPDKVTLNVGETKEVDLNDNGKIDLSVMLKSITSGKADLVFKAIPEVVEQPPAPVIPPTEEAKSNLTWLWILIVLVVIGLVWYFVKKKQ